MPFQTDILIIGGGLAGLTAALHLQRAGLQVTVIEKETYPHHKVCGEYVSNEVMPYLQWLGVNPKELNPTTISRFQFTTLSEKSIFTPLPLGGFGISRFKLDHFLYERFVTRGGLVVHDSIDQISFENDSFTLFTLQGSQIRARYVIGAYGKRSSIDHKLKRPFVQKKSPFLAVKAHYKGEFANDLVALHNFSGGYCGVSKVEDDKINICYLTDYNNFKTYKNISTFQEKVLYQNKHLKDIFENSQPLFEAPLTISQLAFGAKEVVKDHILMIGDTAGLIHPLCGNGMAMAIHSAQICAELLIDVFRGVIQSRAILEKRYLISWDYHFQQRLWMGSNLSAILNKKYLADLLITGMSRIPFIFPMLIRKTHGHIITVK
ncbi:NAD(P)/FAD-dependent oxidoreductase [Pedobacter cryoconitis]|uniref:Flavin-dependent dehydrogenase n=1 Tax=Pedobacter cryoconitis TaxID=188932 RepID=A0A7X0J661_9SPHI|nr:NAD(P)/FAD-dependent oxidoreductase [Pedobacter cryoconitis]MBB6501805.1 flavin-dependent dehydrogenase [Pedobacter cryoconitis]